MTAPPSGFRSRVDGRTIRSLLSMRQFIGEAQNPRTVWALGGSRPTGDQEVAGSSPASPTERTLALGAVAWMAAGRGF